MPVTSRRSAFILVVARVVPLAALVFAVVLPATSALAQRAKSVAARIAHNMQALL